MSSRQTSRTLSGRALLAALLALLSALVLAACGGGDDDGGEAAGGGESAAAVVPADAVAYGEVLIRPEGDVEKGVRTAIERVARIQDPGDMLVRALDEDADERGEFSRDVEPWLGDTFGAFALAPDSLEQDDVDFAIMVAVRDAGAAREYQAEQVRDGEYRRGGEIDGVAYDIDESDGTFTGIVGDWLVNGTPAGFRAVVQTSRGGDALADAEAFTSVQDEIDEDRLAWGWVDPRPLAPLLEDARTSDAEQLAGLGQSLTPERLADADPITMSLVARADEIVIDATADSSLSPEPAEGGEVSITDLPADSWLAFSADGVGDQLRRAVDEFLGEDPAVRSDLDDIERGTGLDLDRDVLGWMGGIAGYVSGTAALDANAGVVIGSTDAAASQRLVSRLRRMVGTMGLQATPTTGAGEGFQVRVPDVPQPVVVLADGERVAIALGLESARDAIEPDESFGGGEPGESALASLGKDFDPSFVLVMDPLLNLVASVGADDDPDYQEVYPYLTAYRSLAAGTRRDGDRLTSRFVASLQEPRDDASRDGSGTTTTP